MANGNIGVGLQQRLNKLGKAITDSANTSKICLAGAFAIERYAKEDDEIPVVTGFLQSTVQSRESDDKKGAEVVAFADYAFYVHMGTEKMPARPFFINTLANREDEIIEAIKTQAQKEINSAMKKGG